MVLRTELNRSIGLSLGTSEMESQDSVVDGDMKEAREEGTCHTCWLLTQIEGRGERRHSSKASSHTWTAGILCLESTMRCRLPSREPEVSARWGLPFQSSFALTAKDTMVMLILSCLKR